MFSPDLGQSLLYHRLPVRLLVPLSSTRGCHRVEFKGFFNRKPIPGPSVNLTVIPDPNKPVGLSVNYDTNAKILAGGTFPGLFLYLLILFSQF